MLAIDGALLPLHLAVARTWKVHYFRGDNAVRAASRDVEAAYLADPRDHLGADAYRALEAIRDALGLDYGGIDFALDAAGNVVVFEANASFAIYFPDDDATAAYRRPIAAAAVDAVRAMIRSRALGGRLEMREHGSITGKTSLHHSDASLVSSFAARSRTNERCNRINAPASAMGSAISAAPPSCRRLRYADKLMRKTLAGDDASIGGAARSRPVRVSAQRNARSSNAA
jgi:hypothetical protein